MRKCVLVVLDGLGDRACEVLGHRTPLQAADAPHLDRLARMGSCGLFHASSPGRALPSEMAHLAMFGYSESDFPGRGPLEALGAGLSLEPGQVACLARLCTVKAVQGRLHLERIRPTSLTGDESRELFRSLEGFEDQGIGVRAVCTGPYTGVLLFSGPANPAFTDTNVMRDNLPVPELLPLLGAGDAAVLTARVVKRFLEHAHRVLSEHPVNKARQEQGLEPVNALLTQRAGRMGRPVPFAERLGMRGASIASGHVYQGLARYLGLEVMGDRDTGDPGRDMARRLDMARKALADYDFLHVHTKAPDQAAHRKDPEEKKRVVESLDREAGPLLLELARDPGVVMAVTADHSTPSLGPLIHSGEPAPLVITGHDVRRDQVERYDEVSTAQGCLGLLRGTELMQSLLNAADRVKLEGIMVTPEDRPFWPGACEAFKLEDS